MVHQGSILLDPVGTQVPDLAPPSHMTIQTPLDLYKVLFFLVSVFLSRLYIVLSIKHTEAAALICLADKDLCFPGSPLNTFYPLFLAADKLLCLVLLFP